MTTHNGLQFDTTQVINPKWNTYDKSVAACHLTNYSIIIIDPKYKQPIDDEYDLEEAYSFINLQ